MIKAVIFDMDGLILDTEKLLVKYWCQAANEAGFPMQREHALNIRSLARKFSDTLFTGHIRRGVRLREDTLPPHGAYETAHFRARA